METAGILAKEFHLKAEHIQSIITLIDDGNTIPFIARYRKEMTGSCDDQVLREVFDRLNYLRNLEKRKEEIINNIEQQQKMTEELLSLIQKSVTMTELEDLYRPYKQKRRTRATIALEKGLEPLTELIQLQNVKQGSLQDLALPFVNEEKEVLTWQEALDGAKDILAERISDDAQLRKNLRMIMRKEGMVASHGVKDVKESVYETYYDYKELVMKIPSHRILAMNRGEREDFLKVAVEVPDEIIIFAINEKFVVNGSITTQTVKETIIDAWTRLIKPSLEREIRNELTEKASTQAIGMFALNLKPLLLQPPIKDKVTIGFDPAYRTGCKIAVVDKTGKILDHTVIYPTPPQNKVDEASKVLKQLIQKYDADVISIGNGTASKESEIFIAELIGQLDREVGYMVVNESGASVYSASKLAAQEFPDLDVSIRSAVSIARRLQDPLAELVKIDPKSIGVGQYQHDMPPAQLDSALCGVVEDCVNSVGVDLNTASHSLLSYISGINSTIAKNIVAYRDENGSFQSRTEIKKVPRLGAKAYEQCAGFLRIPNGKNILDNTSVHPESYTAAKKLIELLGYKQKELDAGFADIEQRIKNIEETAQQCGVGVPTLKDMIVELKKPGRDLRDDLPAPMLRKDIMDMKDLKEGMELTGTVRNVIDFGAFVDIGVHQDGLVHISQLTDRYIKHPSEVVSVGDVVTVKVLSVDTAKKRISLTMKKI
ncbi:MAG: Tex family protein [Christensenellaceae bacterium]